MDNKQHNKSGKSTLSLLEYSEEDLEVHWKTAIQKGKVTSDMMENSPCLFTNAQDGRFSVGGKKICFSYQLVAWKKFGRDSMVAIPSNKTDQNDLVISHICGNGPRCIRDTHLALEPKKVNDERTHCHFCLRNVFKREGSEGVTKALNLGICSHDQQCCTEK